MHNALIQNSTPSALVTDYSLHRQMTSIGMAEQVLNAGALGYSPPEFSSTSKPCPSLKSDVYAFGVILLELLTGKIAGEIICMNDGVVDLTDWVRMLDLEERVSECYDRHIMGVENSEGAPQALDGRHAHHKVAVRRDSPLLVSTTACITVRPPKHMLNPSPGTSSSASLYAFKSSCTIPWDPTTACEGALSD